MSWEFDFENVEIWGTVVTFQIPKGSAPLSDFQDAVSESAQYFKDIDLKFSTYRSDSQISKIRRGELKIEECDAEVKLVWNRCIELRELTLRAFDPWAVPGGFDPSGFVKGWAAQEALRFFAIRGIEHLQINAGGDIVVRGG